MKLAEISNMLKQSILNISVKHDPKKSGRGSSILTQATTGRSFECSPFMGLVNPPTEHDACHGKDEENPGRSALACRVAGE